MTAIVEMESIPLTTFVGTESVNPSDDEGAAHRKLNDYLTNNDKHGFIEEYASRYNRPLQKDRTTDLFRFLQSMNDVCLNRAVGYWKEESIFVIHELVRNMDNSYDNGFLGFLENKPNLSNIYGKDTHQQTWLHAVVSHNSNKDIVKFVMENLRVSPYSQDEMGNTVLHDFCLNTTDDNVKEIISLLMGDNIDLLTLENKNKQTPLGIACSRKHVLNALRNFVEFDNLQKHVDFFGKSFTSIKKIDIPSGQDIAAFWIDIFTENDKSKLLAYMKDVEGFKKMYFLEDERTFLGTFRKCANNTALKNEITENTKKIINRNKELYDIFRFPGIPHCHFYESAPFLALLTGRWNLVMPLVAFSPFEVVPFCLLTCAVCDKLKLLKNIGEASQKKIDEMHQSADAYMAEIMDVMHRKYTGSMEHDIVYDYLTKRRSFFNGSLMDVGYFANCKKFLNTFACQTILSRLWKEKHGRCLSPYQKFSVHSIFHLLFLLCLFFILLINRRTEIRGLEILCYLYGIGYFIEEVKQMLYYLQGQQLTHYFYDATNVVDLMGLASFLIAFVLRCSTSFSDYSDYHAKHQNMKAFSAQLFLSLTSIFLSIRLLYFLSVFKTFGPKLKMIERMIVIDLLPVAVIFFVFILSFGVSFQSLIFSGLSNEILTIERNSSSTTESIINHLADILWRPTFTIFEPKFVIDEATESKSPSFQNPIVKLVVQFLLIMFIIIVSIMLMNMLIALFSQTVCDLRLTTKESWAIDRWKLIREYAKKSYLVPPLNIIEIVVFLVKSFRKTGKSTKPRGRERDMETGYKEDDINPFTILFLIAENRFELLDNIGIQGMSDDFIKTMNLLRNKMDALEEMLKHTTSILRREIS